MKLRTHNVAIYAAGREPLTWLCSLQRVPFWWRVYTETTPKIRGSVPSPLWFVAARINDRFERRGKYAIA